MEGFGLLIQHESYIYTKSGKYKEEHFVIFTHERITVHRRKTTVENSKRTVCLRNIRRTIRVTPVVLPPYKFLSQDSAIHHERSSGQYFACYS